MTINNKFQLVIRQCQNSLHLLCQCLPPLLPTVIYFTCYHLVFYQQEESSPEGSLMNSTTTTANFTPTRLDAARQQWLDLLSGLLSYTLHYTLWSVVWGAITFILTSRTVEVLLFNLVGRLSRGLLQMEPEDFLIEL